MNIRIVFKGMDHSLPFEEHAHQRLTEKLSKFIQEETPLTVDVIAESNHGNQDHAIEIRLNSHRFHLIANQRGTDLYKTFNTAVSIISDEIKRQKEKMLDARDHTTDPFQELEDKND